MGRLRSRATLPYRAWSWEFPSGMDRWGWRAQEKQSFLRVSEDVGVRWLGSRGHTYGLSGVRRALPTAGDLLPSFGPRTPTRGGRGVEAMAPGHHP